MSVPRWKQAFETVAMTRTMRVKDYDTGRTHVLSMDFLAPGVKRLQFGNSFAITLDESELKKLKDLLS